MRWPEHGAARQDDRPWVTSTSTAWVSSCPTDGVLLDEITFRVGEGAKVALVGANGAGKTTLLRIITGDLPASSGSVTDLGGLGVMRQFVGSVRDSSTVRDLLRVGGTSCGCVRPARRSTPRRTR